MRGARSGFHAVGLISHCLNIMSEEKAHEHYQGEEGKRYHELKRSIPEAAYPWVARSRAAKIAPFVREEDTVFEYGVGFGWNLGELRCRRRVGFDLADFLGPIVRQHGIEFIEETRSLSDGMADVVVCHHTLEHVLHPADVLQEIRRVLRAGGTLLLFAPYEKERRYRQHRAEEPNHHLYSWNVQTLGNLVLETGFRLVAGRIAKFRLDRFAAVWACRLRLGEPGFRCIRGVGLALQPEYEVRIVASKP